MFTDNFVTECYYFQGTSASPILFELVLRLRKLELLYRCKIHMVHISVTRMIVQGTDGLSSIHDDGSNGRLAHVVFCTPGFLCYREARKFGGVGELMVERWEGQMAGPRGVV
jgi:hypothetical protein